jgi:hypothetical protein
MSKLPEKAYIRAINPFGISTGTKEKQRKIALTAEQEADVCNNWYLKTFKKERND